MEKDIFTYRLQKEFHILEKGGAYGVPITV